MNGCHCTGPHVPRKIVLTGGPGAGKTAVLELVRKVLCAHVEVLPESAGILFGGGFPRSRAAPIQRAAQRAIFYVQRELETTVVNDVSIILCDRGTVDSLAYWPGPDDFFASLGTTHAEQLARYHAVIHLRVPGADIGYNHRNPLRIETAAEAALIDERIDAAWADHPRHINIPATHDFLEKAHAAVAIIRGELPACCSAAASAA